MMTRPVDSSTRIGARGEKSDWPESPRYAEVGRGRVAAKEEIKMRRGRRDLMNVERAWPSVGRGAPSVGFLY